MRRAPFPIAASQIIATCGVRYRSMRERKISVPKVLSWLRALPQIYAALTILSFRDRTPNSPGLRYPVIGMPIKDASGTARIVRRVRAALADLDRNTSVN